MTKRKRNLYVILIIICTLASVVGIFALENQSTNLGGKDFSFEASLIAGCFLVIGAILIAITVSGKIID
ncbi:hypothetical protein A2903_03095 [Candidatus Nomurabacteria bacterium RIFCSPLOWO2_01_FULL_33_17]|uniref:DUF3955 domain-containing protein n=1 Tax=Candidatus Nomurabacteria bacterium RIFCSPLOWO2_01_FULL_33_17 TaxID=1801764 RepID=A0A1F6WQY8_9BACT|nr:MAG: hypothetical protein A2903_03095 [Candidatus Nomurabacteria bacterium RIFCSPLOWO2_01_FULL_33_17]